MAVLLGGDGCVRVDLGGGVQYVAEVFQWELRLGRETLDTTRQGDEARRRTGGLADHTGSISYRAVLYQDGGMVASAWQLLNFILNNTDDDLGCWLDLLLQTSPQGSCGADGIWIPIRPCGLVAGRS